MSLSKGSQENSFCACAVLDKMALYDGMPYLRGSENCLTLIYILINFASNNPSVAKILNNMLAISTLMYSQNQSYCTS